MAKQHTPNPLPTKPSKHSAIERKLNWGPIVRYLVLLSGLVGLFVAGCVLSDRFATVSNQRDVLQFVAVNGLLAVGMTFVILTGGIDLSVGSLVSVCSVVCAMLVMPADFQADGVSSRWINTCLGSAQLTRAHAIIIPAIVIIGGLVGWAVGRGIGAIILKPTPQTPKSGVRLGLSGICAVMVIAAILISIRGMFQVQFSTTAVLFIVPMVGAMLGMLSGIVIAKTKLQPFIVTLGMMVFAVGLARMIAGDGGRVHPVYFGEQAALQSFEDLGEMQFVTLDQTEPRNGHEPRPIKLFPVAAVFMLGCWAVGAFLLRKLPLGRHIYAVGGNEEAARLSGVQTDRVKIFVYAVSGLLAGLAGVLYCAQYTQGKADAGSMKELDAIAAVVIGGTSLMGGRGSILGTLVGIMIFGYLSNILNLKAVPNEMQYILKGLIIVAAAAVQSEHVMGMFRRAWARCVAVLASPKQVNS